MSLVAWALVGLIAGAIGQRVVGTEKRGCLGTMAVGVLGAFLGGGLYKWLRGSDVEVFDEFDLFSILVASLGAVGLLLVLDAVGDRQRHSGGRRRRR
jgi:uncharacterized membrane protein YeaQ/YmgE (transglycosylase-associated protein family)